MRRIFDEKLADIHQELSQLGRLVNEAIYKSVKALITHDAKLAQEVINQDAKINQKENEIDQKCYEIIALEQPNTSDLRKILAIIRASADLERMGDHARNISKVTINVKGNKRDANLEKEIAQIGDKINSMCSDIIDAFVALDVNLARSIAQKDTEVDEQYQQLRMSSIELMKKDVDSIIAAADYSFVGMHLERIGDYITNIAEWIVYLDTGEIVDLD